MDHASPNICLADSDEEDYVSFDEAELNTGIADLYDNDSASDYNEDSEEADIEEIEAIEREASDPLPDAPPSAQQQVHHFPTPQSAQNAAAPQPAAANGGGGGLFSGLFGGVVSKSAARRSSIGDDDDGDDGMEWGGLDMTESAVSAPRGSGRKKKGKKSKHSQLNKRLHRLQRVQEAAKRRSKSKKVVHRQKVNTNIIQIDLGTLKEAAENIATGDPFCCTSCGAMLSVHDSLHKQLDDVKLDDDGESIWVCSFCAAVNVIDIEDEERPTAETVDYILAPPPTQNEEAKSGDADDSQIVFCIDVSGSMCVSQQIDAKHSHFKLKGNRLNEAHDDLSAFIDGNANHLNQAASDRQYVSRLQCVQTAVDEQMESISKSHPQRKLGVVTFSDEVTVIGDAMSGVEVVAGDKLQDLEKLKEIGTGCSIGKNIGECRQKLSSALWALKEGGQTALGPALAVSIAMASSRPGSQVILCTDGLANVGVGSLEGADGDNDDDEDPVLKWYEALGDYAVNNGVIVNIISITDDGCRLENLGRIVEITNGNLRRINPLNLAEKFSGIIENESVATKCQAKMILHPGLKFHDSVEAAQLDLDAVHKKEDEAIAAASTSAAKEAQSAAPNPDGVDLEKKEDDGGDAAAAPEAAPEAAPDAAVEQQSQSAADKLNAGRTVHAVSRSLKDCGNVFEGSRIFFEYVVDKKRRDQFKALQALPFQVQIEYQKKDGSRMLRVISQSKAVTLDRQALRNELDFNLLADHATTVTTELCAKGDYESSRMWTASNMNFMNRNVLHRGQALAMANYAQQNVALDHAMNRQLEEERHRAVFAEPEMAAAPQRKKKKKMRKSARNDVFSSHMYSMKSKSRK